MARWFVFIALFIVNSVCTYKLQDPDLYKVFDQLYNELEQQRSMENANDVPVDFIKYTERLQVPEFGQVGGLATEKNGNLVVFHRASRKWSIDSFDENNNFNAEKYKVIKKATMAHVNTKTGKIENEWGQDEFYMPHGLTIDAHGSYWLTDVALHQVYKYENGKFDVPALKLGVAFENGNDEKHFCKPTDVAVSSVNGDIFVADGYCNSRVVQFDKDGKFIKEFKTSDNDPLAIPHSVALIEELNLVCVADRENGRIVCFDVETSEVTQVINHEKMTRVFAIEYNKETELLHAVSGPSYKQRPLGFTFNAAKGVVFGDFLFQWEPPTDKHFEDPHDLTTSPNGHVIYTGELNGSIDEFQLE